MITASCVIRCLRIFKLASDLARELASKLSSRPLYTSARVENSKLHLFNTWYILLRIPILKTDSCMFEGLFSYKPQRRIDPMSAFRFEAPRKPPFLLLCTRFDTKHHRALAYPLGRKMGTSYTHGFTKAFVRPRSFLSLIFPLHHLTPKR